MKRVLIVFSAAMFSSALAIGTARADCAVSATPVANQICGPQPEPSTSPTTQPKPKPKPTPTHAPVSHPKPATHETTMQPLPSTHGVNTTAMGITPQEAAAQERIPVDNNQYLPSTPYGSYSGFSTFGAKPKSGGDTWGLKILIMLSLALGGTVWLRSARVRDAMIGITDEA